MMIMDENPVLTVEEAGRLLRLSRGSAYEAVRRGDIPTIRIGRRLLVPRARLMAMLEQDAPEKILRERISQALKGA